MMSSEKCRIKILIAADYILGYGIENMLKKAKDIKVVGKVQSTVKAVNAVNVYSPNVLILDTELFKTEGHMLMEHIRSNHISTRTLLLGSQLDEEELLQIFKMGIYGYISKNILPADIIKAIKVVNDGIIWADRRLLSKIINNYSHNESGIKKLSSREQELSRLIAKGYTNKEIASRLFISEKTVKTHLTNIFKKKGVGSRLEIALNVLKST